MSLSGGPGSGLARMRGHSASDVAGPLKAIRVRLACATSNEPASAVRATKKKASVIINHGRLFDDGCGDRI